MLLPQNTTELLGKLSDEDLYPALIDQLNKDFLLSNLDIQFEPDIIPEVLKLSLERILFDLLTNSYDDYLNLIYRIDLSEKELAKIRGFDQQKVITELCYLILKREYLKVWFRNKL